MKNFKDIAEKCLKGELSGIFILRNGRKVHSSLLSRFDSTDFPYKLNNFCYYSNGSYLLPNISDIDVVNFIPNMKERNVKLTLNKAKEWYEKGGELKEVALQAYKEEELKDCRPKSWNEYIRQVIEKEGYYINLDSDIKRFDYGAGNSKCNRNLLPTKELAEAFLAYMQLISLRKAWIGEWEPNWTDSTPKWCIINIKNSILVDYLYCCIKPLAFPSEKMANDFINCFKNLLEEAKGLY